MGIAFAVVYFPTLGITILIVVFAAHKLAISFPHARRLSASEILAFALGLVSMTVIALLSAAAVPAQQKDFQQFATQVLLTLLMPGIVGGVVAGACNARFRADPATALLIGNRAGLGAMNATWAIPILVFNFGDRFFLT